MITTQTATTAAHGCDAFVVTNSKVLSTSIVFVSMGSYSGSLIIENPATAKVSDCFIGVVRGVIFANCWWFFSCFFSSGIAHGDSFSIDWWFVYCSSMQWSFFGGVGWYFES